LDEPAAMMIRLHPAARYSRRIVLWAYAHGIICVLSKDKRWRDIVVAFKERQ
jgi:hypothetical protein